MNIIGGGNKPVQQYFNIITIINGQIIFSFINNSKSGPTGLVHGLQIDWEEQSTGCYFGHL
jgi:hypothetical protein